MLYTFVYGHHHLFIDDQLHWLQHRCLVKPLMKLATMLTLHIGILLQKGTCCFSYVDGLTYKTLRSLIKWTFKTFQPSRNRCLFRPLKIITNTLLQAFYPLFHIICICTFLHIEIFTINAWMFAVYSKELNSTNVTRKKSRVYWCKIFQEWYKSGEVWGNLPAVVSSIFTSFPSVFSDPPRLRVIQRDLRGIFHPASIFYLAAANSHRLRSLSTILLSRLLDCSIPSYGFTIVTSLLPAHETWARAGGTPVLCSLLASMQF